VAGGFRPDEHSRDGVLTFGFRTALPPSQFLKNQWLWEFVTRYSGATVLDFHEVPSVGYDGWTDHPLLSKNKAEILFPQDGMQLLFWRLLNSPYRLYYETGNLCRSPCALFFEGSRGKLSRRDAHGAHYFSMAKRRAATGIGNKMAAKKWKSEFFCPYFLPFIRWLDFITGLAKAGERGASLDKGGAAHDDGRSSFLGRA